MEDAGIHRVTRIVAQAEVQIPQQKPPPPLGRLVRVGVLAAGVPVAVPIAHRVPQGDHPRPRIDVQQRVRLREEVRGVGLVHGLDEFENPTVVVRENLVGFLFPVPAVAALLEDVACRGERLQRGVVAREVGELPVHREFEPVVNLEDLPSDLFGEPAFDVVGADVQGVAVDVPAPAAVDVDMHKALGTERNADAAGHPETDFLALRRVLARGLEAVEVELVRAEKLVFVGHVQVIRAEVADRAVVGRANERASAVIRARVVNDAVRPVHERGRQGGVVQRLPARPQVDVGLGHPDAVDAEVAGRLFLPEPHQRLAGGGAQRIEVGRGGRAPVQRTNVIGNDRPRRLPRQQGAVDAVPGDGVARGPVVQHVQHVGHGRRVHPVAERHGRNGIRVADARRNQHALARGREDRTLDGIPNRRADVRLRPAVDQARRAQVCRDVHPA